MRKNDVAHEFLALTQKRYRPCRTAHGGGFEKSVEYTQSQAGALPLPGLHYGASEIEQWKCCRALYCQNENRRCSSPQPPYGLLEQLPALLIILELIEAGAGRSQQNHIARLGRRVGLM